MYHVDLESVRQDVPPGMSVPPLLERFGAWLAGIPQGALGSFDGVAGEVFSLWISDDAVNLAMSRALGVFVLLGDGSRVALWNHGADDPAVVLLGAEGDLTTLAPDLETFLVRWSEGESGVGELDTPDPDVRTADGPGPQALAAWLAAAGVRASTGRTAPDFGAWVEQLVDKTGPARDAALATLATAEAGDVAPVVLEGLTARLAVLIEALTDDANVIRFCDDLGLDLQQIPGPEEFGDLNFPRAGLTLEFVWPWGGGNERIAAQYPLTLRRALEDRRVRMLWGVTLHAAGNTRRGRRHERPVVHEGFPGPLPAGIRFTDTRESLLDQLGPPHRETSNSPFGDCLTWYDPGTDAALVVDLSPGSDGPYGLPLPLGAIRSVGVRLRSGFPAELASAVHAM